MAEIVNLRQARKALTRADKERKATENRTRFGRTKAEKARSQAEEELRQRQLDRHLRDHDE